jgi:tetratricopeptide (TPR) repeat protein
MSSSKYKICDNCGTENSIGANYCGECGASLKKSIALESKTKSASDGKGKKAVQGDKNKNDSKKVLSNTKILYVGIGLILLGFVILYGAGVFNQPELPSDANLSNPAGDPHGGIDMSSLQQINTLEERVSQNPSDYESTLKLAHLLNDSGFYEKAIGYYKRYLDKHPENADVHVDMGVCYFELRDYDNAVKQMKTAIGYVPNHQIAHFNLGIVNFSFEKEEEALNWWRKAIEIDPNSQIAKKAEELINQN